MTCRNCTFLRVPPDKDGRRRPRKDKAYTCTIDAPVPVLPTSITKSYGFRWPPSRDYMTPDDGERCPCWVEFVPKEPVKE
jgi:hypothetical protein